MERAIIRQALSRATDVGDYALLADALGFAPVQHPIDYLSEASSELATRLKPLAGSLSRVGGFEFSRAHAGLWVAVLPQWGEREADRERARRRVAKSLVELAPASDRNVLLVLTANGATDIEVVLPRRRSNGSLGTVRALVNRPNPTRHHLELLESLILNPDDSTADITRRWSDAFNVEKVTKSFYLEFRGLRDRLVEVLKSENPANPLLGVADGETAESDLRRYVTRNLGRVLFLWFIQSKGWLNGDAHYLLNLYNTRCRTNHEHDFYRETLIPLFFDALAKKPHHRPKAAQALGELPYLNGGLFIQTAFEDRLYGEEREHVNVVIPNDVFDPRVHDPKTPTVLGLLASYRFTTRESTPDDQSLDPDPELLGKVFENLNEDRKKTGTFYTPREVVRFMCREALDGYLRDRTGVASETLDALRLEALDPAATDLRLAVEERARLQRALLEVKVCDPAVGSGAFPVGMLQEIIQLLIGIEQSADVSVSVGGQRVAEWKERVIINCLYGVDINPEAVEICHLRLWLSMVIDADKPVPLPNLDFRFEVGDSLVDQIAGMPLLDSLPAAEQSALALGSLSDAQSELERLRRDYALATDPDEARGLRAAVKAAQIEAVRTQIDELIVQCQAAARGRHTRLSELRHLGAVGAQTRKPQRAAEEMGKRVAMLKDIRKQLSPEAPYKRPFLWPVEFPEVFESGGFDIVVGNPPYVRMELHNNSSDAYLRSAFGEVFSPRADLLVYFFARSEQIMRRDGHLAFITSSSFLKRQFGVPLRDHLARTMSLLCCVDFGELPVFDATVEALVIIAKKADPKGNSVRCVQLEPVVLRDTGRNRVTLTEVRTALESLVEHVRDRSLVIAQELLTSARWRFESEAVLRLLHRLLVSGRPLGEVLAGRQCAGIKTGLNEAFVLSSSERERLVGQDPGSSALIRPWIRGADVTPGRVQWHGQYLIYSGRGVEIERYPAVHRHLELFRERLEQRATSGLHPWYELQQPQEGFADRFLEPKLVWPDIAREVRFGWDEAGLLPDMTVFTAFNPPHELLGLLNSQTGRFLIHQLTGTLPGGFTRLKQDYLAPFPVPEVDAVVRSELSIGSALDAEEAMVRARWDRAAVTAWRLSEEDEATLQEWFHSKAVGSQVR